MDSLLKKKLQASIATLKEDLKNTDTATLDENTINSYLDALRKIFVVEDMPAWNPNLRSKTAIRTADTHYFVDPIFSSEHDCPVPVGYNAKKSKNHHRFLLF